MTIWVLTKPLPTVEATLSGPFAVSDNEATVTCPATTALAPTMSITCSATHTVSQADLDTGHVTNTATAHASFTYDGHSSVTTITSNSDSVTVHGTQSPALSLHKSSSATGYAAVGDSLSYSYDLTNTGNAPLTAGDTVTLVIPPPEAR